MRYFPTFVDTRERNCLLVGGGPAAAAKLRLLAASEACVTVVAADIDPAMEAAMRAMAASGRCDLRRRAFREDDLDGQALAFVAGDDQAQVGRVAAAARRHGVPVNVVDCPELCDFIVPSIVDRDPLVIAISSSGTAPVLARRLRHQLEAWLPRRLGDLARFAGRFRQAVKLRFRTTDQRRCFWSDFFDGGVAEKILAGAEQQAREAMLHLINGGPDQRPGPRLTVIAAASEDPENLTLGALRRLWEADLVICDLPGPVAAGLRDHLRRDAELVDLAAAQGARQSVSSALLTAADAGRRVVCLAAPDHFVVRQPTFLRARGYTAELIYCGADGAVPAPLTDDTDPPLVRAVGL